MKNVILTPRLAAAASYISPGARVADIGTDHGLLPAYLAVRGENPYIIAADVKKGPLESAVRTAEEYGVSEKIDFRLADGLLGMESCGLDAVLIAGMGGETIASILASSPWAAGEGVRLILQPQSKLPELSDALTEMGVFVTDARLVRDAGRMYLVLAAEKCGGARPDAGEKYAPRALLDNRDPLLPEYLDRLISRLSRAEAGMAKGGKSGGELGKALTRLIDMKRETEAWQG